jgi:hypothetical protein
LRSLAEPLNERRVVVAHAERHETAVRLATVLLGDPEVAFTFDETGDEMALGGGNRTIHLQIVPFRPAATLSRSFHNGSYKAR